MQRPNRYRIDLHLTTCGQPCEVMKQVFVRSVGASVDEGLKSDVTDRSFLGLG
jgi:hypothetical protein